MKVLVAVLSQEATLGTTGRLSPVCESALQSLLDHSSDDVAAITISQPVSSRSEAEDLARSISGLASQYGVDVEVSLSADRVRLRLSRRDEQATGIDGH